MPEAQVWLLDQLLEDWLGLWPVPNLVPPEQWIPLERMAVEQNQSDGTLVIRATLPNVDPEKEVDLTVSNGVLRIHAEHRGDRAPVRTAASNAIRSATKPSPGPCPSPQESTPMASRRRLPTASLR